MKKPTHTAKKASQRKTTRIDTVSDCRKKANTWGKNEDEETREALFQYLLLRARCLRHGTIDHLRHMNRALKLHADAAKVLRPDEADSGQAPDPSQS